MHYLSKVRARILKHALEICSGKAAAVYSMLACLPDKKDELSDWAIELACFCRDGLSDENDIRDLILLLIGIVTSLRHGLTPEPSHMAQINLYCKTNGRIQELLSLITKSTEESTNPLL